MEANLSRDGTHFRMVLREMRRIFLYEAHKEKTRGGD